MNFYPRGVAVRSCLLLALIPVFSGCASTAPVSNSEAPPTTTGTSGQSAAESKTETRSYVFDCGGGFRFDATFEDERVRLDFPDKTITLPHVISGSGARYSDGKTTFWNKGSNALLEIDGKTYSDCAGKPK